MMTASEPVHALKVRTTSKTRGTGKPRATIVRFRFPRDHHAPSPIRARPRVVSTPVPADGIVRPIDADVANGRSMEGGECSTPTSRADRRIAPPGHVLRRLSRGERREDSGPVTPAPDILRDSPAPAHPLFPPLLRNPSLMIETLKSDDIVNKVGGRFKLTALVQRRLKELIIDGERPLVDRAGRTDLELVIEEIRQGKIEPDFSETGYIADPAERRRAAGL